MTKVKMNALVGLDNKDEKRAIEGNGSQCRIGELRTAALTKIKEEFYKFLKFENIVKTVKPLVVAGAMVVGFNSACFSQELELFKKNEKWGYKDKATGEVVIEPKYEVSLGFYDGLAMVGVCAGKRRGDLIHKYGFIDNTGSVVIPLIYDQAKSFSEGLASVCLYDGHINGIPKYKCGFIDRTGEVVISLIYDKTAAFRDGLASVCLYDGHINGIPKYKYGFIDRTGKVVIPLVYDYAGSLFEGLAQVWLKGKYGYIDNTGQVVVPIIYDRVSPIFHEGLIRVKKDGREFYVDKQGNYVKDYIDPRKTVSSTQFNVDTVKVPRNHKIRLRNGEEWQVISRSEREDDRILSLNDRHRGVNISSALIKFDDFRDSYALLRKDGRIYCVEDCERYEFLTEERGIRALYIYHKYGRAAFEEFHKLYGKK